jgi:ABC-type branched-subunit amino acid transport system permease subunit
VVTLAFAFTIDALVFNWTGFTGGLGGRSVDSPTLFGLNLGIASGHSYPRIIFGALVSPAAFSAFNSVTLLAIVYVASVGRVSGAVVAGIMLSANGLLVKSPTLDPARRRPPVRPPDSPTCR